MARVYATRDAFVNGVFVKAGHVAEVGTPPSPLPSWLSLTDDPVGPSGAALFHIANADTYSTSADIEAGARAAQAPRAESLANNTQLREQSAAQSRVPWGVWSGRR